MYVNVLQKEENLLTVDNLTIYQKLVLPVGITKCVVLNLGQAKQLSMRLVIMLISKVKIAKTLLFGLMSQACKTVKYQR